MRFAHEAGALDSDATTGAKVLVEIWAHGAQPLAAVAPNSAADDAIDDDRVRSVQFEIDHALDQRNARLEQLQIRLVLN